MRHVTLSSFEDKIGALLHSDPLLPAQYLESFQRQTYLQPEKDLMLAVLEDGITCYQKYLSARDRKGQALFREAEQWIFGDAEGDGLFSFKTICDFLGINPDYIRGVLLRWRQEAASRSRRAGRSNRLSRKRMRSAA